jgi:hypothetical protein
VLLLWVLIGFVVFWLAIAAFVAFSTELCPRCGMQLPRQFGAPWKSADLCRCGWSRD